MRLWHESLIPYLSNQRLLGQHRECCALRGNGWGRKQSTVNYVFDYDPLYLYRYHLVVMDECYKRGINIDCKWRDPGYRGKYCHKWLILSGRCSGKSIEFHIGSIYPEHDDNYLKECLNLLEERGEHIEL